MNDDFPDFVVRSGSQHHVSVSEHTGNAKTPKNVVVSSPEETRERKIAFDHAHDVSNSAETAQDKDPLPPASTQTASASNNAKANVLSVPITVLAPNKQDVNVDSVRDHRQAIEPDNAIGINRQTTTSTAATSANVQNVATEVIAANKQALPTQALKDNVQSIAGEAVVPDNVQSIARDLLEDNHAMIDAAPVVTNRQTVPQDDARVNRQVLNNTAPTANRQPGLASATNANEQRITTLHVQDHQHGVDNADGTADNHQAIDAEKIADHLEKLPGSELARAAIKAPSEANKPKIPDPGSTSADAHAPGALSAEEKKLKHEEAAAAFKRRLLGIKHNVDNLNDRLTDFERKLP